MYKKVNKEVKKVISDIKFKAYDDSHDKLGIERNILSSSQD